MTYLSHPVRRIRENPVEGASVTLLVKATEDPDALTEQLDELGEVEERLRFETIKVRVDQGDVDAVCSLGGIAAIETGNTLAMDADGAGEDVDPAG